MGLTPYNRSYVRLLAPVAASSTVLLLIRTIFSLPPHEWVIVGAALLLGYVTFVATALLVGLDADDRVIVHAVLAKLRGMRSDIEVLR